MFFSTLLLCLTLLYFRKRWPDLDVIDLYIIFLALHFGLYPLLRSFYWAKGVVFDSYNNSPLVVDLVFLQVLFIVVIIRVGSRFFPAKVQEYLKIKTLMGQWARVDNFIVLSLYTLLILFQIISYYQYGVKSHIHPADFAKIGKDLPYWLMAIRTIYNFLVLCVFVVLASKAALAESRRRFFWLALILIFLPFGAYFGRKVFANIAVIGAVIWLVKNEEKIFKLKNLMIAGLVLISFVFVSNVYETYRNNLQTMGVSLRELPNPISAALNFNATVANLKIRPGTWEFNYLVLDRQMKSPVKVTTDGRIYQEGLKSVIPRILWPNKKFQMTNEVLAEALNAKLEEVTLGTNIFGVAQAEFGYFSLVVLPATILLLVLIMAGLMKITLNYPAFCWLFSVSILNFFMHVEENYSEFWFMFRNLIGVLTVFLIFMLINKFFMGFKAKTVVP
jgi:hypothetical protein